MKKKMAFALLAFSLSLTGLQAQAGLQKGIGVIIFADGDDLSVYRGNALKSYTVSGGTVIGLQLEGGDLVQTGPGTTAEIQLLPSQTVIRVSENTSFKLTGLNTAAGSTIDIIYGRLRAKVDPVLGQAGFSVRGKTAVAAVRGTDFGFDVVAVPGIGQEPSSQVYCFDGTVDVNPLQPEDWNNAAASQVYDPAAFKDRKKYTVAAGQMVSVFDTPDDNSKAVLGKSAGKDSISSEGQRSLVISPSMKPSIEAYWKKHPVHGQPFDNETIQSRFYGLKIAADAGIDQAAPATAKPETAVLASGIQASLADSIEPLGAGKAISLLSPNQYVLMDSPLKLTGIIMGSTGLAFNLAGLALYNFGADLGITQNIYQPAGMATVISSNVLLLSGIVCYIVGLFQ